MNPMLETQDYTSDILKAPDLSRKAAEVTSEAIVSLMRHCELPTTPPPESQHAEEQNRLRDACSKRNLASAVLLEQSMRTGYIIANTTYGHCHPDVRVYIATYTLLAALLDNSSVPMETLAAYIAGQAVDGEPILEWFSECLLQAYDYYVPFAADAIVISTKKWFNSQLLDDLIGGKPSDFGNTRFAEYRRLISGDSEAYTYFLFDKSTFPDVSRYIQIVPDAVLIFNYINDIASFYKEELAEEPNTYVHDRACASGKTHEVVLHELVGETAASYKNAAQILSGTSEGDIWRRFVVGYFYFHVCCDRYRLKELDMFSSL